MTSKDSSPDPNNLGQKIKHFRTRAGLSQLQLEIKVSAAEGALSRIESGKVNPTKETLSKIAHALNLKPAESSSLLGLEIFSAQELIKAINTLSNSFELNTTLQTAVDIMYDLFPNYNGATICLLNDKGELYGKTLSNTPLMPRALKLLGVPFHKIRWMPHHHNYMIRSVNENRIFQGFDAVEFTRGGVPEAVIRLCANLLGFASGITIPLVFEGKVIGVIFYTKRVREVFGKEEELTLQLLADQIAIAIKKAEHIERINKQIRSLEKQLHRLKQLNS